MSCSMSEKQKRIDAALAQIELRPELRAQLAAYYRAKGERKARLNKGR